MIHVKHLTQYQANGKWSVNVAAVNYASEKTLKNKWFL